MADEAPIVIVGAGQAGGWAAKTLRDAGYTGNLALVGAEAHPPYERPPLSKAVLAGQADAASTHFFRSNVFSALQLDWRPGVTVTAIDRAHRALTLSDGGRLGYRRLLLCTGGRPRRLPPYVARDIPVHYLRTIDDALALQRVLRAAHRVLVVGGGWIGLEIAAVARAKGAQVCVLEAASHVVARVLPPALAAHVRELHVAHGTAIVEGRQLVSLQPDPAGASCTATLDDGSVLAADAVIAGIGLEANDALAREAGLACTPSGVLVDERCATSDPYIFAAGDVAVAPNSWIGTAARLESWQNAQDQGIAAARAALGLDIRYDPLPRFWSEQYGQTMQILGFPRSDDAVVLRGRPADGRWLAFTHRDGQLRAVLACNAARDLREARRLLERRDVPDEARLADSAVPLATL